MLRLAVLFSLVTVGCQARDTGYYCFRGEIRLYDNDFVGAIADFNEAIRLNPENAKAYKLRGNTWEFTGEYSKAIDDYSRCLQLDPKFLLAYAHRGDVWAILGEYQRALDDFNQARSIDPNFAAAYSGLSWLESTCPDKSFRDGRSAFENANKARELRGVNWGSFDIVAAAYAECGDFDRAVEFEEKSIGFADEIGVRDEKKRDLRARLALYKERKPFRQSPVADRTF